MIHLMLGNNWDLELLKGVDNLNLKYADSEIRILELYGSHRNNPIGSARPAFRLPDISNYQVEKFIEAAHDVGIKINYTLNTTHIGNIEKFDVCSAVDFVQYLRRIGVDRVTCAHPLIMQMVTDFSNMPIEVSTIMNTNHIAQPAYYAELYNVSKICMSVYRNRDIEFLQNYNIMARQKGIIVELMANEFCMIGNAYCEGLFRQSCYGVHSCGGNEHHVFGNYPMNNCINSRNEMASSWLKARFILPQDMVKYGHATGIKHFKITGRTHPTSYCLYLAEEYMKQDFKGNLLSLWIHLENIGKQHSEYSNKTTVNIPASELTNFLDRWLMNPSFRCDEHCGFDCAYCDEVYRKIHTPK